MILKEKKVRVDSKNKFPGLGNCNDINRLQNILKSGKMLVAKFVSP